MLAARLEIDAPSPARSDDLVALLARAGQGDEVAFITFYDLTWERAYAAACRVVVPELAERVTRAAYVHVWRHSGRVVETDDPLAIILSQVWQLAERERRRIRREHEALGHRRREA